MTSAMIPTYLGHSYRPEDRELNQHFLDQFWEAGFAFTVDPKAGEHLSIPHLELMMQRSACFVAIVPHRDEERRYKTSPYIVFEQQMAVRAKKPRLALVESRVAGRHFDGDHRSVFQHGAPATAERLPALLHDLRRQINGQAQNVDDVLGSVAVVLPAGDAYDAASRAIGDVLDAAGYEVDTFRYDPSWTPDFSEVDKHDFFVIDIGVQEMTWGLYWRFVPTIKLGRRSEERSEDALPAMFRNEALEQAVVGGSSQNVIWWSDVDELIGQLEPVVDKMQRPRRQFRSHDEGAGYFQSLGRDSQGPVFLSNAKRQNDLAGDLSRALNLANIDFFQYRHRNPIPMGTAWEAALRDQVRRSRLFIALVSEDYGRSEQCRQELRAAQDLAAQSTLRIYKYFLDDEPDVLGATDRLQGADLTGMDRDDQVRRIVRDIDRFLTVGTNKGAS